VASRASPFSSKASRGSRHYDDKRRNRDYVRGLGADEVIDYNAQDFTKVVTVVTLSSILSGAT